jgi:pimeloyl-ACP methyl ester carboxylesterase
MQAGIPHARIELFPKAGHFIMLDDANPFLSKLKEFLDQAEPNS